MTSIESYFTGRYKERLLELQKQVKQLSLDCNAALICEDDFRIKLQKLLIFFFENTKLHITKFEFDKMLVSDLDLRFAKFVTEEWLIEFLQRKNSIEEIV